MSDIPDRKKWQRRQEELGRILSMPERAFVAGELKSRDEMDLEALADFLWGGSDDLETARLAMDAAWGGVADE